jgi:hypothetical protein
MRYNKSYKPTPFPIISITCSGYQKQFATLLREKIERIRAARGIKRRTVRERGSSLMTRSKRNKTEKRRH